MSFSKETQNSIIQFSKEQARHHLENAELSYFDRLNKKGSQLKSKVIKNISKFKLTSKQAQEAQDDLLLYMSDYMSDLIEQGCSESEALEKARTTLAYDSNTSESEDIQNKYMNFFDTMDPAIYESIGLYYGASTIAGMVIGALVGLIAAVKIFPEYFWITIIISIIAGLLLGTTCGMLKHASIITKLNNQ